MAKLTLADIATTINTTSSVASINANNALLETALENTLSRDGTSPNTMDAEFDMNNYKIVNLDTPTANTDAATKGYVDTTLTDGVDANDGWSPQLAVVEDGTRRVLQLVSYTGGEGTAPTEGVGEYFDGTGTTATIGNATDIRGAQGTSGAGTGDLLAANNLSDVANAGTSRTNLGLAIGTDVLAQQTIGIADDNLLEVDGSPNANEYARFTANGLEGRTEAEFKADFNLETGTDLQAYDAGLLSIAGLTTAADKMIYTTASDTYTTADLTSAGRALLDDASASDQRTTLGLGGHSTADLASQAQAEAGTDNTTAMSPLRVAQAITALETGGGAVTLLTSGTFSSSSTLEIVLSSYTAYRKLVIELTEVHPSQDKKLYCRLSNDGGSTYESGASAYKYVGTDSDAFDGVVGETNGDPATFIQLGPKMGSNTNESFNATIEIANHNNATYKTTVRCRGEGVDSADDVQMWSFAGMRAAAETNDAIQIYMEVGNLDAGSWAIYGWS